MTFSSDAVRPLDLQVPVTFRRSELGWAAWHALVRDGVLRPLWGDVAVPADVDPTPELRCTALTDVVPRRAVVGRCAAAWVHTGRDAPHRVDVLVAARAHRVAPHPQRATAEASFAPGDVVRVGPLRVTTVQRTGLDVARWLPERRAVPVLAGLCEAGFDPDRALCDLGALPGHRGVRRARTALRALRRG